MKILIIYYSRTNTTKKIALELRNLLHCDIEEIIDLKDRSGAFGYIVAGSDTMRKKIVDIKELEYNPIDYDLVLIGTPIWVGTMSSAIRTYIVNNRNKFKEIVVFVTQGFKNRQKVFDEIQKLSGLKLKAELQLTTKEVMNNEFKNKAEEFVSKIQLTHTNLKDNI